MRSFLGFGQVNYIGQPSAQPVKLAGIATNVIPLLFPWLAYGASTATPNINVLISIRTKVCDPLGQIRSIYIDNLGSPNPIYAYFPDTGYTVAAKANSEGWYPVYTNTREFQIIGEGFLTGSVPTTFVLLSNIPMTPSVNVELDQAVALWKASPLITRGTSIYNTNLGTPALGDQTSNHSSSFGGPGPLLDHLWGTPYSSGFVYLTHVSLKLVQLNSNAVGTGVVSFVIESTGASGILYTYGVNVPSSSFVPEVTLIELSSMNVKLNATENWRIRITGYNNWASLISIIDTWNYTIQP